MNKNFFFWKALILLLLSFTIGCAPSSETLKKEEMAITARNLGEKYMVENNFPKAIKEFTRAEQLDPKDPITQYHMGLAFRASAKTTRNPTSKSTFLDLAVKHYKKALDLDPDYSEARNNLGNVYMDQQKWDKAIECYEKVSKDLVYPTPYFPLSNLGWAYYNKNDYALAEKYYLDALNLEPRFLLAILGLGRTYIAMGKTLDAVGVLEKAAEVYPQTPEVYFDLADAYKASKNVKKAIEAYRKVITLSPNSVQAYKANQEIERINQ